MFSILFSILYYMGYIFLEVPYKDKEEAKQLECKWNKELKKWYVAQNNIGLECILEKWDIKYLDIPYKDKEEVKSKGAKWNKELKKLYTYKSNMHFVDFPNALQKLI